MAMDSIGVMVLLAISTLPAATIAFAPHYRHLKRTKTAAGRRDYARPYQSHPREMTAALRVVLKAAPEDTRSTDRTSNSDDDDGDDESSSSTSSSVDWEKLSAELVGEDEDDGLNDGDWLPDSERARLERQQARVYVEKVQEEKKEKQQKDPVPASGTPRASPYTDEEEEVIAAMGGKTHHPDRKREQGFLGDSTLQEIASDYSVPISYICDVLCMWGVPIPIHVHDRLGDLVTGEQAFSLLEACNSMDVSQLHDRYSNTNVQNLCYEWDISLQAAFELAMKEGWSLPFGVQTCLRVEQEDELLRVLGDQSQMDYTDDYEDPAGFND